MPAENQSGNFKQTSIAGRGGWSFLTLLFPYLVASAVVAIIVWGKVKAADDGQAPASARDPVCGMSVRGDAEFKLQHEGELYYFCTEYCLKKFAENPTYYSSLRCYVCGKEINDAAAAVEEAYQGETLHFDSPECRLLFSADPLQYVRHKMRGVPGWLYYPSIAVVLVASFVLFEIAGRRRRGRREALLAGDGSPSSDAAATTNPSAGDQKGRSTPFPPARDGQIETQERYPTFEILRSDAARRMLSARPTQFVFQLPVVALFLLLIAAGLFGSQYAGNNITPLTTWTIWWCGLVIAILYLGKIWCFVCPWDAIASWVQRLHFWRKTDDPFTLGLKWPKAFRNITIATFLFVGLTWLELGFGITLSPRSTAYVALLMLAMAVVSAIFFDRKSFCRYACLVGRVSGLYALFSSIELRSRDKSICERCQAKPCYNGSERGYGCPTYEAPSTMDLNTYCILCSECIKTCPYNNISVRLRPWAADLVKSVHPRSDEAYLALLMLSITGFHGLTMTPVWGKLVEKIQSAGLGYLLAFSLGMIAIMLGPVVIYFLLTSLSKFLSGNKEVPLKTYFIRYAYALLPIALFYHLAHNAEHLLMEGQNIAVLLSDPFGWGWDVFGTATWRPPRLVSFTTLWYIQILLVLIGHIYSLWIAERVSKRIFSDPGQATRSQAPMLIGMIAFSVFSLWLLKQPMEMRGSFM